jgi:hypothetical protein
LSLKRARATSAHVVASQGNIVYADLNGNTEHVQDPVVGEVNSGLRL